MAAEEGAKEEPKVEAKEELADRRRLLVAGDVEGNLVKLFAQVESQQKRVGAFDVLFAVGGFLPVVGGEGAAAAGAALAEYVTGKRQAPVDTYFIESRSTAFISAAPEGKKLCERVHFLGGFGVREIRGLRVAYLSGRYDPAVYGALEVGDAGSPFVGAAYTPQAIEGLITLAREQGSSPIDVLLTAEWPKGLTDKMGDAHGPVDPDDVPINWQEISSHPIAELVAALEPRYHIFGSADIFYQRPPFQTPRSGHVCRCIGLGRVGSKGKGRQWVHGLALSPAKSMPEAALMQRPANTTPSPFVVRAPPRAAAGVKRDADEMDGGDDGGQVIPDQVFLSRLPANIDEKRLAAAFRHVGKIERIHLAREESAEGKPCRGYGWVTFSSPEEAQAACDLSEMLECNGKKIVICLSKPKGQGEGGAPRKKREVQIVIEPHSDCWFCLVNPKVEKHMIVSASKDVYLATARGPVVPTHVMVLPVKHAPCFAACPPELQAAIQAHVQAIRKMCQEGGQEILVWERWIPMSVSAANHMQIQILPIDQVTAGKAREVLQETTMRYLPKVSLKRIKTHAEVFEHMNDSAETPYVYFEVPGDNSAKGRQTERYMYAGVDGEGPRIPINFGRQVACDLLGLDRKVDWRACTEERDAEKDLAATFRAQFLPFAPKRK
mmetsp:Transcript_44570/g.127816  ORF Transcript_44570/g.127816 Transcript_44570/m.127816 type:complete len:664 (-) Transcript_44570:38-2029(-)